MRYVCSIACYAVSPRSEGTTPLWHWAHRSGPQRWTGTSLDFTKDVHTLLLVTGSRLQTGFLKGSATVWPVADLTFSVDVVGLSRPAASSSLIIDLHAAEPHRNLTLWLLLIKLLIGLGDMDQKSDQYTKYILIFFLQSESKRSVKVRSYMWRVVWNISVNKNQKNKWWTGFFTWFICSNNNNM